ncbi:hypothetical protein [Corynebacterium sp. A21]|uniref:hypothetical protein n=1 Tax=Corynebacterium sp. A21 TaxID=3457318 RepID=UPI003FD63211
MAAVSAVLTGVGALVVCMSSVIADFNDYPGFTCVQRRTPELEELRTAWYAPLDTDPTLVRPFLFHSHEYELFPVGMQCTEWPPGYQELAVTTHSHWIYTVLFYSLLMFALLQAIRVTRPGILDRRAAHPRPNP